MARPETSEALQALILEANETGRTLEPRGGGSKAAIGRPEPADDTLDMTAFSGVIDYDPAELVLTCGAGTPLAEIEALVEAEGQMLPFEPVDHAALLGGEPGRATLGGVLAANVSGPRRVSAGSARDHFLGLEAVSGRGELFKAGGQVVKNVTGYDLPKLVAGSWGTLAALTRVTVKVLPKPRASATLVLEGLADREACAALGRALGSTAPVSAAAHLPAEGRTVLRLEGVEPAIGAGIERLNALLGGGERLDGAESAALWRRIGQVGPLLGEAGVVWRVSLPPADGWRIAAPLKALGARWFYDWAGGLVWIALPEDHEGDIGDFRLTVMQLGGHATLVRAPAAVRAAVPTFQPEPPALAALSARVRAAFDPRGVLSPRHRPGG